MSELIAPPMSDNQALRRIVARLDAVISRLLGDYTKVVGGSVAVEFDEAVEVRASLEKSLKTVVTNTGENRVKIMESGFTVAILNPDQTWESAAAGKLKITAQTLVDGETSTVAFATYKQP